MNECGARGSAVAPLRTHIVVFGGFLDIFSSREIHLSEVFMVFLQIMLLKCVNNFCFVSLIFCFELFGAFLFLPKGFECFHFYRIQVDPAFFFLKCTLEQ